MWDPKFPGGVYRSKSKSMMTFDERSFERERAQCEKNGCPQKAGNYRCDQECNTYACDFDGRDCSLGIDPWKNCTAPINCVNVFNNHVCDELCNNAACLFDGHDCDRKLQTCNPIYDAYCKQRYADGTCDKACNNAECNWDGLDCDPDPPQLAKGTISVIVQMDMYEFRKNLVDFLRMLGHVLRSTVRVKTDAFGHQQIFPWSLNEASSDRQNVIGVLVNLELDNRRCITSEGMECFANAEGAAEYIAAKAAKNSLSEAFPIYKVRSEERGSEPKEAPTNVFLGLVGVLLVLVIVVVGVLMTNKRKANAITWFPDGFLSHSGQRRRSRRRGPDGQEMRNLSKQASMACIDVDGLPPHPGMGGQFIRIVYLLIKTFRYISLHFSKTSGFLKKTGVAVINANFQIRQRRYHQCSKQLNFKSANAATNPT